VTSGQQPRDGRAIAIEFVDPLDRDRAPTRGVGSYPQPHNVSDGFGAHHNVQRVTRQPIAGAHRRNQRQTHGMQQGGRISQYGHDTVRYFYAYRPHSKVGMMGMQLAGLSDHVSHQQRLEPGITALWQLPQRAQQSFQSLGVGAQTLQHPLVRRLRTVQHERHGRNRRHAIAHIMYQATQQIVMYQQPARRTVVVAHD